MRLLLKKDNHYPVLIAGEKVLLLPEKGLYWEAPKSLFISDVHFGKVDHFRKNGLAIPGKASSDNYTRLDSLLKKTSPREVIFLGDLFHSHSNNDWLACKAFLSSYPAIKFSLVLGNHDIIPLDSFEAIFHKVYSKPIITGPFILSHEPLENDHEKFNICGHIHPAYRISYRGRPSLRLPCFYLTDTTCILPAFGTFTGMHTLEKKKQDQVYVIAENEVIPCQ